jgi:hypothetical protein
VADGKHQRVEQRLNEFVAKLKVKAYPPKAKTGTSGGFGRNKHAYGENLYVHPLEHPA